MSHANVPTTVRNVIASVVTLYLLSGCLTDSEEANELDGSMIENRVSGSVGDGPVVGSDLRMWQNDGLEVAQLVSSENANYTTTIVAAMQAYPILIESTGGTDLVTNLPPDFVLLGAALRPERQSVANLNPFTTLSIELAGHMSGGVTVSNIENAEGIVTAALGSGLSTLANSGPLETHIDETNIAEVVKSSETLAEAVRRTRDLATGAGFARSGDDIIAALGSDLTDSVVDGQGAAGSDPRIAAIMTVVYAQVLMEAMSNELRVNGSDASTAMQIAIDQVSVRTPVVAVSDLQTTRQMIERARVGLAAAFAVAGDPNLQALHSAVSGLQSGMDAATVRTFLPGDYRGRLQVALGLVAGGDDALISAVNAIARSNGDIDASNSPPVVSGTPGSTAPVGSTYSFTPVASDPDGDSLTFAIENRPSWASFDSTNGRLTGTPQMADVGSYPGIRIVVSDGNLTAATAPFTIDVTAGNGAPTISGSAPGSVVVGQNYDFTAVASDPDGDALTFSIVNQPSWASFDSTSGALTGTPQPGDVANYTNIVISVSDGTFTASLPPFSIQVVNSNLPPTISGSPPATVTAGQTYQFTPTASDPNAGDVLVFSIVNRPTWASFSTDTGTLSGVPASGDVGTNGNITISVFDGQATASLPAFSIQVLATNSPPTISGTPPAQVNANIAYSFQPVASDPDAGDTLTFSIIGLPTWASFDTSTGQLSGTPGDADVGLYSNIEIVVSDGSAEASIGPFSITVQAVSLGSVTLSWTPPTQNEDGSPLTNLAGYRFYWGQTPGTYPNSVTVNNPGISSYVVENLVPGTYEFVATSVNTDGIESVYSNPVTKTVQ